MAVAGRCVNSPGRGPHLARGENVADLSRPCADCGAPITARSPKAQRCDPCRYERKRALNREAVRRCHAAHRERRAEYGAEWRAANPGYQAEWRRARLADPEWVKRERERSARGRQRRKLRDPEYFARWARLNPETGRRSRRTRRARKMAALTERYTTTEIAERDGWRCGLCGRKVNVRANYPSPMSASIDHVIPLAEGGHDIKANVQLAHLGCNIKKGRKAAGEQLRLIG